MASYSVCSPPALKDKRKVNLHSFPGLCLLCHVRDCRKHVNTFMCIFLLVKRWHCCKRLGELRPESKL